MKSLLLSPSSTIKVDLSSQQVRRMEKLLEDGAPNLLEEDKMNSHARHEEESPDGTNDSAIHDANVPSNAPGSSSDVPKVIGQKVTETSEWEFEARSSRDGAWYDVGSFLSCRFHNTGEPKKMIMNTFKTKVGGW